MNDGGHNEGQRGGWGGGGHPTAPRGGRGVRSRHPPKEVEEMAHPSKSRRRRRHRLPSARQEGLGYSFSSSKLSPLHTHNPRRSPGRLLQRRSDGGRLRPWCTHSRAPGTRHGAVGCACPPPPPPHPPRPVRTDTTTSSSTTHTGYDPPTWSQRHGSQRRGGRAPLRHRSWRWWSQRARR